MVAPRKPSFLEGLASGNARAGGKRRVGEGIASGNATIGSFDKKSPPIPRPKPKQVTSGGGKKTTSPITKGKVLGKPAGIGSFSDIRRVAEAKRRGTRSYEK